MCMKARSCLHRMAQKKRKSPPMSLLISGAMLLHAQRSASSSSSESREFQTECSSNNDQPPSSPRQLNRQTGIIIYHLPTRCGVHSRVVGELEAIRHRNFFPFSFRFCFNTRDFARQRQA